MQASADNILFLTISGVAAMLLMAVGFIFVQTRNRNKILLQRQKIDESELLHQAELLNVIVASQEIERKRIGQDLHDDVGTSLSHLRLTIEMFAQSKSTEVIEFQNRSKLIIDKIITNVRHISHNLSPPGIEHYGFLGAMEDLCDSIVTTGALEVDLVNESESLENMTQTEAISVYRIMEELLNNTIKHARASQSIIRIDDLGMFIRFIYTDNGIGILSSEKLSNGMGMQNIESRLKIIGAKRSSNKFTGSGFRFEFAISKRS